MDKNDKMDKGKSEKKMTKVNNVKVSMSKVSTSCRNFKSDE